MKKLKKRALKKPIRYGFHIEVLVNGTKFTRVFEGVARPRTCYDLLSNEFGRNKWLLMTQLHLT